MVDSFVTKFREFISTRGWAVGEIFEKLKVDPFVLDVECASASRDFWSRSFVDGSLFVESTLSEISIDCRAFLLIFVIMLGYPLLTFRLYDDASVSRRIF